MTPVAADRYVCLVNGSLRGDESSSCHFLNSVEQRLRANGHAVRRIAAEPGSGFQYAAETLRILNEAAAVVLACPLYGYCLPGGLMRLLEAWAEHAGQNRPRTGLRFYGIVNCGFPVPETMEEALRVIKHFCARLGFAYRFSVAVASGPVAVMTERVDLRLKRAYRAIAEDVGLDSRGPMRDVYLKPLVPRFFMDRIREYLDARVQRNIERAARRG